MVGMVMVGGDDAGRKCGKHGGEGEGRYGGCRLDFLPAGRRMHVKFSRRISDLDQVSLGRSEVLALTNL